MSPRLDAHAHLFFPGYVNRLPESCRRQLPDEITMYQAHAQEHEIAQVLAVGYEGAAWAVGNNQYIASLAQERSWLRPIAHVNDASQLTRDQLSAWNHQNFVGISLHIFSTVQAETLSRVSTEVWQWLSENSWMISINSSGEYWRSWEPILSLHPELTLLIAHLGLPPATQAPLPPDKARSSLKSVLQLASFANVHVKFSGFYALAQPEHAYPHVAAWPYAQAITETFGTTRIVWGSDFSPALEVVSFPQTVEVLNAMAWLTAADLTAIYHDNLAALLKVIEQRKSQP
jgi:L-fuconolactonase